MANLNIMNLLNQATTKLYMTDLPIGEYQAKFTGIREIEGNRLTNTRPFSCLVFTINYKGQEIECTDFITHQDIAEAEQIENLSKKFTIIQKAVMGSTNLSPAEMYQQLLNMSSVNVWITKRLDAQGIVRTNLRYSEPVLLTAENLLAD